MLWFFHPPTPNWTRKIKSIEPNSPEQCPSGNCLFGWLGGWGRKSRWIDTHAYSRGGRREKGTARLTQTKCLFSVRLGIAKYFSREQKDQSRATARECCLLRASNNKLLFQDNSARLRNVGLFCEYREEVQAVACRHIFGWSAVPIGGRKAESIAKVEMNNFRKYSPRRMAIGTEAFEILS